MTGWITSQLQRIAVRAVGSITRPKKRREPLRLEEISRILLLRNDALGDAIVTTPVWRTLKRLKPDLTIGVLASRKNQEMLRADPDVDFVFQLDRDTLSNVGELKRIRSHHWDVVMCLVYNKKTNSALLAKLLALGALTSVVAFGKYEKYEPMFSIVSRQRSGAGAHMTEVVRQHLQDTISLGSLNEWHPSLSIPGESVSLVRRLLHDQLGQSAPDYILLNLHASVESREWGLPNAIAFCREWVSRHHNTSIVITRDPSRALNADELRELSQIEGVIVLPPLSQLELFAVVRGARLVLTPDTSVTHIASAERRPVVTLHYRDNEWYPFGVPHRILRTAPGQSVPDIPVDEVIRSVEELLSTN